MDNSTWIDFALFPKTEGGFSHLYIDYLSEFQKVHRFYEWDFHLPPTMTGLAEKIRSRIRHRDLLVEVLTDQNRPLGASEATFDNIQRLARDDTFAVVTGQQVGVLGGPLYTMYKTITTIKLAKKLSESFGEYSFVPVFWLEGEDHDFEEVNKTLILNSDHQPTKIEYLIGGKRVHKNLGPVGELQLDSSTDLFFQQLQKALPGSEFKESLLELLKRIYSPSSTFNVAFARLLNTFFSEDGLVFVSSNDRRLKQLMAPIFLREIEEYPRVSQRIIQQSAQIEEHYHAQIKTKAMNLFLFHKGGRYFIEPREHDFSLRGTRQFLQREDLIRTVNETPELISPNVALRPICQDTVLPTFAYVGGPAEIAYFAQLKPVYQDFGLPMPVIYPRASATLLEEKQERVIEKFQLELMEFFQDGNRVTKKVMELVSEVNIDEMFGEAFRRVDDLTNEMRFGINYIDSTLVGALENTQSKLQSHLHGLREKVEEAQKRKHEVALRQVRRVTNSIYPNNSLQERELGIIHFINKHGMDFIPWLKNRLEIGHFKHQIIRI